MTHLNENIAYQLGTDVLEEGGSGLVFVLGQANNEVWALDTTNDRVYGGSGTASALNVAGRQGITGTVCYLKLGYANGGRGQGQAHGNGTSYADTQVNAQDNLRIISGHDLVLIGAQATGEHIGVTVGHDMTVISPQATDSYHGSNHAVGGGLIAGAGIITGGISLSQGHADNSYHSVDQASGFQAGAGGYDILVGNHTGLIGGQLASTATPDKNLLNTGSLSYQDLDNRSHWSADQTGLSLSGHPLPSAWGSAGAALGLTTPQHHDNSSTTHAGIAPGTVIVRDDPNQDLGGLNQNQTHLDGSGIKNGFDPAKIARNQETGQVAAEVGMRAAGDLAGEMYQQAATKGDTEGMKAWGDGGVYKDILHGLVGAGTAALGGGNALQGAAGAATSEAASGAMQDYLVKQGIDPNSATGKTLMQLGSAAVGASAGGGATGAGTALAGEQYNRQLHPDETAKLNALKNGKSVEEQQRINDAACALVQCAAGVPEGDPAKATLLASQQRGAGYLDEQTELKATGLYTYGNWDALSDWSIRNQVGTRALGGLQWVGGNAQAVSGVAAGSGCAATGGAGCYLAGYLFASGVDNAQAGFQTLINGTATPTWGGQVLQSLGLSPNAAELVYGATQVAPTMVGAYIFNREVNAEIAANAWARGTYTGESYTQYSGDVSRYALPEHASGTWDIYPGNVAADHRYSPPSVGALYAGTAPETAAAEVASYGALEGKVLVTKGVTINNVLDLTNPAARNALGVTVDQLTQSTHGGQSYEVTQRISAWAREQGYQAILAPSAQNPKGANLISFQSLGNGGPK